MSTELLLRDDVRELTEETAAILSQAEGFKISTAVSYQLAADELKRIKAASKKLDEVRKAITSPMDAAKKAVMDFFRKPAEQLKQAEERIKDAMLVYQTDLEQKEAEERRQAEAAAKAERERLEVAAAREADRGEFGTVAEIATTAAQIVAAPVVRREVPKVAGVSFRETWKFEITDLNAIPREFLLVDETKIRKVVQAMKGDTNIPGVRAYAEKTLAAGAA